jgi:hypothetical protein
MNNNEKHNIATKKNLVIAEVPEREELTVIDITDCKIDFPITNRVAL